MRGVAGYSSAKEEFYFFLLSLLSSSFFWSDIKYFQSTENLEKKRRSENVICFCGKQQKGNKCCPLAIVQRRC